MRLRRRKRDRERKPELRAKAVLGRVADGYRYDWRVLLVGGLIVFVPISVFEAVDLISPLLTDDLNSGLIVLDAAALLVAQFLLPMLGNVLYSGIVAAGDEERRLGERRRFLSIARSLPYFTLIVADLLLLLATVVGLLLLILPGIALLVLTTLIAPVIELERTGPIRCFKRSYVLVKPYFWKVAGLVIPLSMLQGALTALGNEAGPALLGPGFWGDWAGTLAASLLTSPLWALAILALYLELVGLEGERDSAELRLPGAAAA